MKVEFILNYGGCRTYNKKDKNGNKTEEKATQYNLLEVNEESQFVESKPFYIDGENPFNVDVPLLGKVKATIDISPTSSFQKLCDIKPYK